ncbi:hypothetical protein [Winogradskyella sp. R77965]|uniref:hypothetical protein n=1 Tax=Winogradskyella sp. R77965 TaxID=3093872 RepID=UPI0037DCB67B
MKTIKALLLITLITFSSQVSAFTSIPGDEIKPVAQQIEKFLKNSELRIYDETFVMVKFKLNENNKIIITSVDSDNYEIKTFIKASLNKRELSINEDSSKRFYSVPVRFLSTVD